MVVTYGKVSFYGGWFDTKSICSYFNEAYERNWPVVTVFHFNGYNSNHCCWPCTDYKLHSRWKWLIIYVQRRICLSPACLAHAPLECIRLSIDLWKRSCKMLGSLLVAHCCIKFECHNIYNLWRKKVRPCDSLDRSDKCVPFFVVDYLLLAIGSGQTSS